MDTPESLREYLAAIVESSDDAIITKNLDSIIQTWNRSAERLFGYTAEEAVGQPITMLIPEGRQHEEVDIIARLRRGERIQHFETIRIRKDGRSVPISLTISPVRNSSGRVIGASKIARDISLQKEAEERQHLLLAEMRHRVGNCFAVAGSLLTVTARQVESADELVFLMRERLMALSTAHRLAVADPSAETISSTSLHDLISTIIDPFASDKIRDLKIEEIRIASEAITPIALIFYELCTNSAKYGALGKVDGSLAVEARRCGDRYIIDWEERCNIDPKATHEEGFGTSMCHAVLKASLGGTLTRHFETAAMRATIDVDLAILEA